MKSFILPIAFASAAFATPAAAAVTLTAGLSGDVTVSNLIPFPGTTFSLAGGFTSYVATDLPQINGGDLDRYSFEATGTAQSFDVSTFTTTYTNVVSRIFYNVPNGAKLLVQEFQPTTLTVDFTDGTGVEAIVRGRLFSTGAQSPAGFPGPVDFSPANGASFLGAYLRTNAQTGAGTYSATITYPGVPEPATWGLMILGFGLVGAAMRRRNTRLSVA